jgi:hypothetical protein
MNKELPPRLLAAVKKLDEETEAPDIKSLQSSLFSFLHSPIQFETALGVHQIFGLAPSISSKLSVGVKM